MRLSAGRLYHQFQFWVWRREDATPLITLAYLASRLLNKTVRLGKD